MARIGIRELRQNASSWVARAQGGETIEITSRNRLVARLVPVSEADANRETLIAAGQIVPAPRRGRLFDPADLLESDDGPSMSAILDEMRADR